MQVKSSTPGTSQSRFSRERGPRTFDWASPEQAEVFNYGPGPLCASGGFGSGKTWALCLKALWLSDMYPGNRGIIARKIWAELQKTTMATFFKLCPQSLYDKGRRADAEKILRLNNGSEILWMHMDDADIEGVIRGLEINWFLLDQAEEINEEIYDMLMGRLGRWDECTVSDQALALWEVENPGKPWPFVNPGGHIAPPVYPMIACNPDTELHWIYRRFHQDSIEHQQKYKAKGYKMVHLPSTSNKFLPEHNLKLMMENDESFVRRFVKGEWGIPEGVIHKPDPLSLIDGTPEIIDHLRQTCTLHRSLDHGDAAPTCCLWWAVDQAGNVFCYREYYRPNELISNHRENLWQLSNSEDSPERYMFELADPSIFTLTMQKYGGRWSVADEYRDTRNLPEKTAIYWQPADNNELGTRNRINEYLRVDPERIHPFTKEKGSPRLFFIRKSEAYPNGIHHALVQLRSQRYEKAGTDGGRPIFSDERDDTIPDHAYDCVRYFIASRPPVAPTNKPAVKVGTWNAVAAEYRRMKKSGQLAHMQKLAARRKLHG